MLIEEIKNIKSEIDDLRRFGLTIGIFLCLIGLWILWRTKGYYLYQGTNLPREIRVMQWILLSRAIYFFVISGLLVSLGVVSPFLLKPIHKAWMALSIVLGFFVSRLILSLLFYLVVTPIGLLMRLLGKDPLNRKFDKDRATYWISKKSVEFDRSRYENQF